MSDEISDEVKKDGEVINDFEKGVSKVLESLIVFPVQIGSYNVQKSTIKINLYISKEIDSDIQGQLSAMVDKFAVCGLKRQHFVAEEVNALNELIKDEVGEVGGKTPAARLHAVLYVLWKTLNEQGKTGLTFNSFYYDYMERLCERIKAKITSLEI